MTPEEEMLQRFETGLEEVRKERKEANLKMTRLIRKMDDLMEMLQRLKP